MEKNSIFTQYQSAGICEINIQEVQRVWTKNCQISVWQGSEYTVVMYRGRSLTPFAKARISAEQAQELIQNLGLVSNPTLFSSSVIYKNKKN